MDLKKRSILASALVAAMLVALFSASTAQAQKTLRWKFEEGEKLPFATRDLSVTFIDAGGIEIATDLDQKLDTTWTVKSVAADGTATVSQKIDRLQFALDNDFIGELVYDSQSEDNEEAEQSQIWSMVGPLFEAMLAGEIEMKVSPLGEVTDITLSEAMTKFFEERANQEGNQMAAMLMGGMNEEGIKDGIRRSVTMLSGDAVSYGDAWVQELVVGQGGAGSRTTAINYSYGGAAEIDGKSVERIDVSTEISVEAGEDADVEVVEQEGSGSIFFDADAGRVVSATVKQLSVLEISTEERDIIIDAEATSQVVSGTSDDLPEIEEDE